MGEGVTAATWMLHIACACVYLTMAVLVVARRPQAGLNWACGVLILCFFHWSACLAVSHHPSTSAATAELFYDLGALSWASFASLAVLFIAVFWRFRYLRSRWFWAALVLPPAIVIHAQWTGRLAAAYPTYPWGHGFAWRHSPQATFYIAYYALYMVGGLGALLLASFAPGPAVRRRQARVIGLSAIVPLVAGSLTDVWLPRSGSHRIPNMAPDFTLIWVVGLVYAIVRYRMLELTPAVAADRVVETMPDALFLLQPEGRIAWANPAAVQLFGHSRVELREMSLGDLFQLHPTAAAPSGARLLAAGRQDLGGRRQDGGRVDIGLSLAELRGGLGELAGWVAVATDVTSRNQAEAELRRARDTLESRVVERTEELQQVNRRLVDEISVRQRSEEHYRLLIESMHEGLWVLDPEDRTTLVNSRLAAILGCRAADLVGRKLVDFVGEDSLGACTATLKAAHLGQAGQGDWQIEAWPGRRQEVPGEDPVSGRIELGRARADDADGAGEPPADGAGHGHDGWNGALRPPRRLNAIVQISPLLGAGAGAGDGEGTDRGSGYLGAVLTVMDVTERESMRAQLSRAERLASMGLLAAGVGHEINNPLTFVIGNIEEILRLEAARAPSPAEQDAVPPGPPSPVARLADEALAGTFRVREIVRDLRRFSRAETPEVSPIDVREPIEEAIRLAHNQVRFRARLVREPGSPRSS
jgi:PAS domain S-box-containing protein